MMRLKGKVALVTGASRGIGREIANVFSEEGARVYAASSKAPATNYDPPIVGIVLDVASEADWSRAIDQIVGESGRIDILVNNAGIIDYNVLHETDAGTWRAILDVNQTGVFYGMKAVVPAMAERRTGSIVNVGSIWGKAAVSGAHAYHATKGAVGMMTKNAAVTYAKSGIRVNSVLPGFIDTPLTQVQDKETNAKVIASTPMGRPGTPREIAYGCLYLASDEASFVTGAELVIDGGYLAQ